MSAAVGSEQRFTKQHRCPICGGADGDPRGQGKRCSGFISTDGLYAHCSREDHARGLPQENGGTYAHRLNGPCKCGATHREDFATNGHHEIEATYNYTDEKGALLFQVVRFVGKDFRQRQPDGAGGWIWNLRGVRRVLYRLPELLSADNAGRDVFVVEGEKDADTLAREGFLATCNPAGAGKWNGVADSARQVLRGRDVVVIADADEPGRKHAKSIESSLRGVAASVRVVECSKGKDITDHLEAGGTLEEVLDSPPSSENSWESMLVTPTATWYTECPPERVWLLRDCRRRDYPGVFAHGEVGQLIAPGGAGKTMAGGFQLAVSVTTGVHWLGCFQVATRGRVLLVVGEEDASECQRRLYYAAKLAGCAPEPGSIVLLPLKGVSALMVEEQDGKFVDGEFAVWLRDYVARERFALVILDPLSRFGGRESETDNSAATRFIQSLESVAKSGGATVLNAHHTNQVSRGGGRVNATSGRGVTGLVDGARWQCALDVEQLEFEDEQTRDRLGELVTFSVTKSNYARKPQSVLLRRDADHLGCLVPLTTEELESVKLSRQRTNRKAHETARAQQAKAKELMLDLVVFLLVRKTPGLTARNLRKPVKEQGHCGSETADAAIKRARAWLDIRDETFYPPADESRLPAHLRQS